VFAITDVFFPFTTMALAPDMVAAMNTLSQETSFLVNAGTLNFAAQLAALNTTVGTSIANLNTTVINNHNAVSARLTTIDTINQQYVLACHSTAATFSVCPASTYCQCAWLIPLPNDKPLRGPKMQVLAHPRPRTRDELTSTRYFSCLPVSLIFLF
jgi:hypothetical protein